MSPDFPNRNVKIMAVHSFMKYEITLDMLFAGFSVNSCRPGEGVWIVQKEFVSSEDGDLFISRLEGFPELLLNKITQIHKIIIVPSSIDNMFAVLRSDKTATVYINSPMKALMQAKRDVKAGEAVYRDDIADIQKLIFESVEIPDKAGIMALFSVGWRKGLFYDLTLLYEKDQNLNYDLAQLLGGHYAYLMFQEKFKISKSEWENLLLNGWFPFITLSNQLIGNIVSHNREGWNVDDLLPQVQGEVTKIIQNRLTSWIKIAAFQTHMEFISKAAEHYQNNDHLSCISVLFPRIEGVMRSFQSIQGQPEKASQKDLANVVVSPGVNPKDPNMSPLLPLRFGQYLNEVYFANFDPQRLDNPLSRNTVGHGVATKENFNLKGSTLGFLILDQLSYYFGGIK